MLGEDDSGVGGDLSSVESSGGGMFATRVSTRITTKEFVDRSRQETYVRA